MNALEATNNLKQRKHSLDFRLESMETIYQKAKGKPDRPHRHDYYTVLFVSKAKGKHVIDYKTYPFGNLEVHFVSPGQVHQVVVTSKPKGYVITFSRDFLAENNIPESFIQNINLFKEIGENPPLQLDENTYQKLNRVILEMYECLPKDLLYRKRALGALLQLFLIYSNNSLLLDEKQLDEENPNVCILRDFKTLVDEKFQEMHKVNAYAELMNLSSKHLSQTIKNQTGKTAKNLINDRLLLEAKRLLLHTDLSVKEIAYQLGFEEPLHFSGFFKKQAKKSPSEFRGKS